SAAWDKIRVTRSRLQRRSDMRRVLPSFLAAFLVLSWLATLPTTPAIAQDQQHRPIVIREVKHDISPALREIGRPTPSGKRAPRLAPLARPTGPTIASSEPDPVAQKPAGPISITTLLDFDGQAADDVAPPDTNGAVGATQFVQWVNLEYSVYDKNTGALILGPVEGNSFWSGFGGSCETRNDGDIIIQYDKAADRWVAAQPVFVAPYMYCIAVSTTPDSTGTYNRYAFSFGETDFPDYPKLGVWPDAYYGSFNIFKNGARFIGAMACAFDRSNMLAGNPAMAICFQEPK